MRVIESSGSLSNRSDHTLCPGRRDRAHSPHGTLRSRIAAAALSPLVLVCVLLSPRALSAKAIPVRFIEGVTHGFLVLRTLEGGVVASGDLLQISSGAGEVESRMVFRFVDGSLFDETVVYTQQKVFALRTYRLVQRGPAFPEDTEVQLDRETGKYRVSTRSHKDSPPRVLEGVLTLPSDVYNGMLLTVAKSLPQGAGEIVHLVAFTPEPRLIELQIKPAGEHKVLVGALEKTAVHFVFKPRLGMAMQFFARLAGRLPPDCDVWVVMDDVPAFVRFDGPLFTPGPVWRIELTSPRWPGTPE